MFKRMLTAADTPFLELTRLLLRLLYRKFGLSPLRARPLLIFVCGLADLVVGTALVSRYSEDSIYGFAFTFGGIVFAAIGWKFLARIPKGYTASAYKANLALAAIKRETMLGPRVNFLAVATVFATVLAYDLTTGSWTDALVHTGFLVLFLCMTLGEYSQAAEPPDPDEGDWQQVASPSSA